MAKIVTLSPDAREALIRGVNILANAVKVTLGPKGRHVIVENDYQNAAVTKDGVTVAKSIILPDPVENLGAQIVKGAAQKAVEVCGDGTTTTTLLAQQLLLNADVLIQKGVSPVDIKKEYEGYAKFVIEFVNSTAKSVTFDSPELLQVASIAANNDSELGTIISDAVSRAKDTGIVLVEESKSTETFLEMVEGCRIDRGYTSGYFINNIAKQSCELNSPVVFITDKKLRRTEEIIPIMDAARKLQKPLLVIAEEIEAQAIAQMVVNRIQSGFPCLAVKAPAYGERRTAILQDLAILTGAKFFSETKGDSIANFTTDDFGVVDKVVSTVGHTTFVGGKGDPEAIAARLVEINAEIADAENDWYRAMHKQRLANLTGTISVLYIGAQTEAELKERKDRVDDSLQATQAAVKNGIVPGAGMMLYHASLSVPYDNADDAIWLAFTSALRSPFETILLNGGYDPEKVQLQLQKRNSELLDTTGEQGFGEQGFNSLTGNYCNLIQEGIIDPALVVTSALEAAISSANLLILTDATVTPEKTQESIYPMGAPQGYEGM